MSSSAEVINLEACLTPIPGDNPAGENLQYAGLHDEIREARRADEELAQGQWQRETKVADWSAVINLAGNALETKTKDLQVCAWLIEALVRVHGFTGLRDGLKLMVGLHEKFWDHVFPEIDEGDLEARANSLAWMSRQLEDAVKRVPITKCRGGVDYSYYQWEESQKFDVPDTLETLDSDALARVEARRQQAAEEGKITGEQWRKAIMRMQDGGTPRAFYEETSRRLDECWNAFLALDKVMDDKFGQQTPGLGNLKSALDSVRSLIAKLVKEKRLAEPDHVDSSLAAKSLTDSAEAGRREAPNALRRSGPIQSRQDALRRLEEVAQYFHETEPHSPVSYLVGRAIRWGQMSLSDWLNDVVKNDSVLDQLRETLGLKGGTNASGGADES
ncbi:MAG: type VI secretion system protein TssA [Acidobacteria bacterium]|nr:type VI secretion system protein TssA [Acidobacteriota bacterium]MBI3655367.1 type VI secretion system protein TssA [Acidobacteriota bacterium]